MQGELVSKISAGTGKKKGVAVKRDPTPGCLKTRAGMWPHLALDGRLPVVSGWVWPGRLGKQRTRKRQRGTEAKTRRTEGLASPSLLCQSQGRNKQR